MRKVDRGEIPAPSVLGSRNRQGFTELEQAIQHFTGSGPRSNFSFKRYKDASVKMALERLFHGKCAYCESRYLSTQPVDVEHFRPKGNMPRLGHPGYWWLAMSWSNLLPSCIDCNRRRKHRIYNISGSKFGPSISYSSTLSGKGSIFPLENEALRASWQPESQLVTAEKPLLLDPTNDSPDEHLIFDVRHPENISLIFPAPCDNDDGQINVEAVQEVDSIGQIISAANYNRVSVRGAVSIHVYGLNRLGLVKERTALLRKLEYLRSVSEETEMLRLEVEERLEDSSIGDGDRLFFRKLNGHLDSLLHRTLEQIQDAMDPQAPYSRLAHAWLEHQMTTDT